MDNTAWVDPFLYEWNKSILFSVLHMNHEYFSFCVFFTTSKYPLAFHMMSPVVLAFPKLTLIYSTSTPLPPIFSLASMIVVKHDFPEEVSPLNNSFLDNFNSCIFHLQKKICAHKYINSTMYCSGSLESTNHYS